MQLSQWCEVCCQECRGVDARCSRGRGMHEHRDLHTPAVVAFMTAATCKAAAECYMLFKRMQHSQAAVHVVDVCGSYIQPAAS